MERHQTLRAAIDWSFDLLTEPEQALLGRLAVFAGGCTLEAGEAVCGGEGIDPGAVFELLASLVTRSLVVAEENGSETRYRLLETIRQYGEEHLDQAGETERWRARHAGYYADLLGRVREHARDPGEEMFWAARLSAEQDNLLAAWSWAIGTGNVDTAFRSWPASRPARSGAVTRCCWPRKRPSSCPARLITRATRSPSRSAQYSRRIART